MIANSHLCPLRHHPELYKQHCIVDTAQNCIEKDAAICPFKCRRTNALNYTDQSRDSYVAKLVQTECSAHPVQTLKR